MTTPKIPTGRILSIIDFQTLKTCTYCLKRNDNQTCEDCQKQEIIYCENCEIILRDLPHKFYKYDYHSDHFVEQIYFRAIAEKEKQNGSVCNGCKQRLDEIIYFKKCNYNGCQNQITGDIKKHYKTKGRMCDECLSGIF